MNEYIMVISTAVIALSTLVYSIFNIKLWMETKSQKQISKYSLLINTLMILDKIAKETAKTNPTEKIIIDCVNNVIINRAFTNVMEDVGVKTAMDFRYSIEKCLRDKGVDAKTIAIYVDKLFNFQTT